MNDAASYATPFTIHNKICNIKLPDETDFFFNFVQSTYIDQFYM